MKFLIDECLSPIVTRPNSAKVRRLCKFSGVDIVLYTELEANIHPIAAKSLAKLSKMGGRDLLSTPARRGHRIRHFQLLS